MAKTIGDVDVQATLPGVPAAPSERQMLENVLNRAVHMVLELQTELRKAQAAERRARAALGALDRS